MLPLDLRIAIAVMPLCSLVACDAAAPSGPAAAPVIAVDPPALAPVPEAPPRPGPARAGEGALARGAIAPPLTTVGDDAARTCEICRFDRGPKLVVLGALGDAALHEPLRDLDAIGQLYADDGLGTFAVLGERAGDRVHAPADADAARREAEGLRTRLRIVAPLLVAASGDDGFDGYRVDRSPTVLLLDRTGAVLWSGVALARWGALDRAILDALAAS